MQTFDVDRVLKIEEINIRWAKDMKSAKAKIHGKKMYVAEEMIKLRPRNVSFFPLFDSQNQIIGSQLFIDEED